MSRRKGRGSRPMFPRKVAPLPTFESPKAAGKRLQWERKQRENAELTEQIWALRMRVKAAFLEGYRAGALMVGVADDLDCWQISDARRDLYPGPPTPLHLAAKLRAHGYKLCDCRRPGGPGQGR